MTGTRAIRTAILASWLPTASLLHAQAATWPIAARDAGAVMYRVADGVYAITHDPATESWPHGNTGVVVGADAILVIDSDYLPSRAAADIALIRSVSPRPIRYLLNTHWHGDHTHGNGVYREIPGLEIVGTSDAAGFIGLNQWKLPRGSLAPDSYNRETLARLETTLERGTDSAGRALTEDERANLIRNIGQRQHELDELAKVQVAPPTRLFGDSLALDLGRRTVLLRNMGAANSPADVIVYVPDARVLFTGDIVVAPLPYTINISIVSWMRVLDRLEAYPIAALVPGHGAVQANYAYPRLIRETLESVRGQIDSLYRLGRNLQQAEAAVDISALRTRYLLSDGRPIGPITWGRYTGSLASQMALCVMGYGRC